MNKLQLCLTSLARCQAQVRMFSSTQTLKGGDPVGFVGLGNMGGHMARNLIKGGHDVVAFDVSQSSLDALKNDGGSVASSPAEVAQGCKQIVTMLPSNPHVMEVYSGSNGILSTVQSGSILIDSSTIAPQTSQEVANKSLEKGAVYLDAPVSGGVNAARDGILTFMVGGPADSFTEAKKLLDLMGKNVVHCGAVGTGQAAKICNNMLLGISMIGTSEAMNLGMRLGLEPKLLASILNSSSGRCWSSELYNPVPGVLPNVPSSNDYKGGFGTALMTKDLGLAQSAALATSTPTPLGGMALQLYRTLCNHGYGGKDFSSTFQWLQEQEKKDGN